MNKHYSFTSHWVLEAPLNEVWNAIYESESWPSWWKGVVSVVELVKGDESGIGSVRRYVLSSPMAYHLQFDLLLTDRIDYQLLKGNASGELEGTGSWTFNQDNGYTYVTCLWEVSTTIRWMNYLAFILAPVFRYNHTKVMQWGAKSLAHKLNCRLIAC